MCCCMSSTAPPGRERSKTNPHGVEGHPSYSKLPELAKVRTQTGIPAFYLPLRVFFLKKEKQRQEGGLSLVCVRERAFSSSCSLSRRAAGACFDSVR